MTSSVPRAHLAGRWIALGLILAAVLMPPTVWLTYRWMEQRIEQQTERLDWSQRAAWPSPPVQWTTLEERGLQFGLRQRAWRDIPFDLSEAEAAIIHEAIAIAQQADEERQAFARDESAEALRALVEADPELFYPAYLLGTWHRLRGEADEASRWYQRAFELAPAAVQQGFYDTRGQPLAELEVGTMAIGCERIEDDQRDLSLVLVYPHLQTDAGGLVRVPVFRTVYRIERMPRPERGRIRYEHDSAWFEFPGRLGTLPPIIVDR